MPTDRSARRILSITTGIAAIFDVTGTTVYRAMRPVLPPGQRPGNRPDPVREAMQMIAAAHQEAVGQARGENGESLPG